MALRDGRATTATLLYLHHAAIIPASVWLSSEPERSSPLCGRANPDLTAAPFYSTLCTDRCDSGAWIPSRGAGLRKAVAESVFSDSVSHTHEG